MVVRREFPSTRALSPEEIAAAGVPEASAGPDATGPLCVIEHERIPFVSYPHEWCPEMLYAAAELTLDLQLRALDVGLSLKDATPTNIVFDGCQPVFVDLLSLAARPAGQAIWPAYAQFVRTFLLPLLMHRMQGVPPHEVHLTRRDGLEPEEAFQRLSWVARWSPAAFQHVTLPAWLGRLSAARTATPARQIGGDEEQAQMILRMLVRGLRRALRRVRPPVVQSSVWSDYMATSNYRDEAFQAKETFVCEALRRFAPRRVLDVGCNTGHFSRLAAEEGAAVVALDYDPIVVGRVWAQAASGNQPILPLVLNLARPSPALGWNNSEMASFLARAGGHFDVALLLAVVHHLTVTDGVPLPEVFRLVAGLIRGGVIVEYVPPEDSMFQRIIRNKEHLVPRLQRANFEAAFAPFFELVAVAAIAGSGRIMYSLAKRVHA
jgi:SAM-dependent methyltransferase